jgi:outer membrane protein assembly factor BamB
LDANGQRDGNAGPFVDEIMYMGAPDGPSDRLSQEDGDIVWRFDLIEKLGVVPHDVCGSSPTFLGDYLYVCTSNGVDDTHRNVANPSAPSLIVLNRHTGKLVAVENAGISARTLHGQWSSPSIVNAGGKKLVLYGGGDGVLYALEPYAGDEQEVEVLKQVWEFDCCPSDYRQRDGQPIAYARWNQKSEDGPSEIIATPVSDEQGRIYVAIGQSPLHGVGRGMLSCIDGASGSCLWQTRAVDRTLSNVALNEGLLYVSDYSGRLHCFDAATGEILWQHDLGSGVWCASPVVAHGKVYISTEKQLLWVFRAGREKQVLARSRLRSEAITPVVDQDVFFLPTQKRLFAVKLR